MIAKRINIPETDCHFEPPHPIVKEELAKLFAHAAIFAAALKFIVISRLSPGIMGIQRENYRKITECSANVPKTHRVLGWRHVVTSCGYQI